MDSIYEGCMKAILEKYADPVFKKLAGVSKDEWEKFKVDFDIVFIKYLKNAFDKYSRAKTILYRTEPRYIYDFFEIPYLEKGHEYQILADNVDKVTDISKHIIIQGIGGTGKSTLMKHLFINELEKKDLIPVFLELKDINEYSSDYDFAKLIFEKLSNLGSSLKEEYLDYAFKSGCFIFFLDGYDEIISEKKSLFFKKLDSFIDRYPDNYYIISSRPYSEFIEFQRFTVLTTCELSKTQAISLVSKIDFDKEIKERFIAALDADLYEKHMSFASNPLLLNIMLLTFDNYAEIPEKLHLFYSNAFETLYSKHDATKAGYRREMKSGLSYDSFRSIFSWFCCSSYAQGKIEFTYDELVSRLSKLSLKKPTFEVNNYIYDLVNSVCVLYKDGLTYKFAHRSFQEYFTAVFLKELPDESMKQFGIQLINNDIFRATHDSVFDMLYDMAEDRFERNILLPLVIGFEENMGENSKYDYYFSKLVHNIKYSKSEKKETDLYLVHHKLDNEEGEIVEFLHRCAYFYLERNTDEEDAASDKLLEYLKQNSYVIGTYVTITEIMTNAELYRLVKNTWIGRRVKVMTELQTLLNEKQKKMELDLSDLLVM